MKRIRRFGLVLFVVVMLTGGCLATDPPTDLIDPPDLATFVTVESGGYHTCALTAQHVAYCWGENSSGQLGTADVTGRMVPWPVAQGAIEFQQISPGVTLSCAVSVERSVYCWGSNGSGQLGIGEISTLWLSVPTKVGGGREYTTVSAGGGHACAINIDRYAFCWGLSESGQLGSGYAGPQPHAFPDSVWGDHLFRAISAGNEHSCALTSGGEAYCWGNGQGGRLGTGSTDNANEPTAVGGGLRFETISAGIDHTCGVAFDGDAYCWGHGSEGQLGTGGVTSSEVPVLVAGDLVFVDISAGGGYSCGVTGAGGAYCWGRNEVGQLGEGTLLDRFEPTLVGNGRSFQTVSAGLGAFGSATCGLGSDGLVYCWGDGQGGQTGTGDPIIATSPIRVFGQPG